MAQVTIVNEGAFDKDIRKQINDMFTEVYAAGPAVGAIVGPSSATSGGVVTYDGTTGKLAQDSTKLTSTLVVGPASVTAGKVAVFSGTTGKIIAADAGGATAGPFTTITAIQTVNGLVTVLTGS